MEPQNDSVSDDVKIIEQVLFHQLLMPPIDLQRIAIAVATALSMKPKNTEK